MENQLTSQQNNNLPLSYYEEVARAMIDKENDLINHRVTWLTAIQGLLIAGVGFNWREANSIELIVIFIGLGISISIIQAAALIAATKAIHRITDWWTHNKPQDYRGPGIIGYPPSKKWKNLWFMATWNWIPFLFIVAWLSILATSI